MVGLRESCQEPTWRQDARRDFWWTETRKLFESLLCNGSADNRDGFIKHAAKEIE